MADVFHRILKSADSQLPEWRLRLSAECAHEVDIVEERVLPEQVDDPDARHIKGRDRVRLTREEAIWLRDAMNEWLAAHPDDGNPCGMLACWPANTCRDCAGMSESEASANVETFVTPSTGEIYAQMEMVLDDARRDVAARKAKVRS